jgi:predicted DNA-binding protein
MRSVLSVGLPEELASRLEEYAKSTGRNKSDIVKESLSLFLWEERFRRGRKSLLQKGKRVGLVTEEDVFRAVS